MTVKNTRVIALRNMTPDTAFSFGEGEYIGDLEPDTDWFPEGAKNPCIKLDNGTYVWGFECWWGDVERMTRAIADREVVMVTQVVPVVPKEVHA